ncbi:MAG: phenylacetate--CoA ligase family protein [Magnetococcales bacterium]|nr:phenylacetate--CoA ligase family protein [Magnetococcales bacterium]
MNAHYDWISTADNSWTLKPNDHRFLTRLRHFFTKLHEQSPAYAQRFEEAGFMPPFDDPWSLYLALPSMDKAFYREPLEAEALHRLNHQNTFVCDFSSGSTAQCVLRFSAPIDELAEQSITETVFKRAGMGPGDHFICLEVGVAEIYDFYFRAARNLGVNRTSFLHLTGRYGPSIAPLKKLNPTVILTLPSILARIWPHVKNLWPKGQSPIHTLIHMGESMHSALKAEIQHHWGCRIISFYGTTEIGGMAGECPHNTGCHFEPMNTLLTLTDAKQLDDNTVEGEALFTTLHFTTQPVIKYRVADLLQVTSNPCVCGESTPRLTFLERTRDAFIITGVKFRHSTIMEALREIVPELRYLSIVLDDLSEESGNTRVTLHLPEAFKDQETELLEQVIQGVFDMDAIHRYGLVRFEACFLKDTEFGSRKIRKVIDNRQYMGQQGD